MFLTMWHLPKGWGKVNAKSAPIHDLASQSDLPEPCFTAAARGNRVWHSPSGCLPKESPATPKGKHHGWWLLSEPLGCETSMGYYSMCLHSFAVKLFAEVKWLDRQQRMYLPTCLSLWFLIMREFEIQQYQRQLFLVEHCLSWYALHTMTWHRSVQPCCNKNPQDKVILIGFGSWMRTVLLLLYDASQNVFTFIVQGAWWEVPGRVYSYNLICNSRWSSWAWKEVQPSEIWENRKAHSKPMFSWRQVRKETETDFSYHFHRQCPWKAGKW